MQYFHGGVPGLKPGDAILPPDESGTDHTLSQYVTDERAAHGRRRDVIYMTTGRQVARGYAAFYPDGALYEVAPVGPVVADLDCSTPGLSWQAAAATVVSVVDPVVLFRSRTPRRWLRMLEGSTS